MGSSQWSGNSRRAVVDITSEWGVRKSDRKPILLSRNRGLLNDRKHITWTKWICASQLTQVGIRTQHSQQHVPLN